MSISLGIDFSKSLHNYFESNNNLKYYVKNIFHSLKNSGKYPYIYHKVNGIKNIDTRFLKTYEVEAEINLYSRDSKLEDIKIIISTIEESLANFSSITLPFKFISGKISKAEFSISNDLLTNRVRINFISLIQERG